MDAVPGGGVGGAGAEGRAREGRGTPAGVRELALGRGACDADGGPGVTPRLVPRGDASPAPSRRAATAAPSRGAGNCATSPHRADPQQIVDGLKELGLFGLMIPEEYGGLGESLLT
ncbi:acyl-CoA dehydrogenase family protein, partial [Streptomyces cellulosae]